MAALSITLENSWNSIKSDIQYKQVILGETPTSVTNASRLIILLTKQHIYKIRCLTRNLSLDELCEEISFVKQTELYMAR